MHSVPAAASCHTQRALRSVTAVTISSLLRAKRGAVAFTYTLTFGVQQSQGHTTSTVSARVEMVRDIVGFFEKEVPAIFQNILMIVGSAAMLFVYDVDAGWIAMAVLLPMGLVNGWYWRKALRLNQGIGSEIERWTPSSLADAFASHATSACCGTGA
jgi:ABC-type bacteriocin/lantibiotic exporter with double-glycine peptidase domain